uniref:LRAT domain-containing protein n=1 Tax=Scophthalmus maximus TaxID=52904 RepID=A0A8D3B7M6_SCOMX
MKTPILVALLLLQLSIIIYGTNGYKFGDMISFPRFKACVTPIYKHFAVFVNDKEFPNKKPGEDIFHLTQRVSKCIYFYSSGGCHFGKLSDEPEQALSNYPDVTHVDNDAKIEARILEKIKTCGKYNLLTNNCEHLATYVRYGVASTKQVCGTFSSVGHQQGDQGNLVAVTFPAKPIWFSCSETSV